MLEEPSPYGSITPTGQKGNWSVAISETELINSLDRTTFHIIIIN